MKRIALVALVLVSCRGKGEGTNIPEGKLCVVPDDRSVCATGLYCDTSRSFEELEGNTYVRYGLCTKMKNVGDSCYGKECAPPAVCVFPPNTDIVDVLTSQAEGVCHKP